MFLQTHGVLLQYLELLTSPSVILPEEYAKKILPALPELSQNYGICAPVCMYIIRPVLHASLLVCLLLSKSDIPLRTFAPVFRPGTARTRTTRSRKASQGCPHC